MAVLNPYLMFAGNAREAMEFYQSVLGGTLEVMTFGDAGASGPDGPPAEGVMHSMLMTEQGFNLMGSDMAPGAEGTPANGSLSISGDESELLHGYWDALSDGGEVEVPLETQMWGDEFGTVNDRFGVNWLINIAGPQRS